MAHVLVYFFNSVGSVLCSTVEGFTPSSRPNLAVAQPYRAIYPELLVFLLRR